MRCSTIFLSLLLPLIVNAFFIAKSSDLTNPRVDKIKVLSNILTRLNNSEGIKSDSDSDSKNRSALFLTPFIESGQIQKAQELAAVPPMLKNIESFAGYLTVNKTTSSNLFFWLFKSQLTNWEERPLVIWLQGGPGSSSLFGLFTEIGPFWVDKDYTLQRREYSWNRKYNLLFIDNPVGAGFSFTKLESGYARTVTDVTRDLYEALVQFYQLFPVMRKNKLIIAGESYAGKYVPAIGYKIYQMNKIASSRLPLSGLVIGSGLTDPYNMMHYGPYLYELGLIDEQERDRLLDAESKLKANIRAGKYEEAYYQHQLNENLQETTGLFSYYNFIHDNVVVNEPYVRFLEGPKTRNAIHVGNNEFNNLKNDIQEYLSMDYYVSVKPLVEELLTAEEFPILFYSGQLDIIVAYPLSRDFYNTLKWPHAADYHFAKRCKLIVDDEVAGYYKTAGTFTEVLVRNAGHMVPTDQPKWANSLLDRFITNSSSFLCE